MESKSASSVAAAHPAQNDSYVGLAGGPVGGEARALSASDRAAHDLAAKSAIRSSYNRHLPSSRYLSTVDKWEAYLPPNLAFSRERSVLTAEYVDAWREDMLELEGLNENLQSAILAQRKAHKTTQQKLTSSQEDLASQSRLLLAAQDETRDLKLQLQRAEHARAADEEERHQHLEERARRIAALSAELNAANARAAVSQQEASDLRGQLASSQAHVQELEREVSKLSRLHDCMHSDRAAAVLEQRNLTEEARREVERLKGEASSSSDLARRVSELQTLLAAAQEELRAEMRRGSAGMEQVGASKAARAAAEAQSDALAQQLQDSNGERQDLKCKLARLEQESACEGKKTKQKLALAKLMLKLAHRKNAQLQDAMQAAAQEAHAELHAQQTHAQHAAMKAESRARALFKALRFTTLRMKLSSATQGMRSAFDTWRMCSMQLYTVRRADVLPLLLQRKQHNAAWMKLCVCMANIVQNRLNQKSVLRAWLQWRRVMWAGAAVQPPRSVQPVARPAEAETTATEVHHWHHFDDSVDIDDPKQQPVLCYGAVASDLPSQSHVRSLQRAAPRPPAPHTAPAAKPKHVFYPTDQNPHSAMRKHQGRAAHRSVAVQRTVQGVHAHTRAGATSRSRHCPACEQVAGGQRSSAKHSLQPGHCHQAAQHVSNPTTARQVRDRETHAQVQRLQHNTQLQQRRQRALVDSQHHSTTQQQTQRDFAYASDSSSVEDDVSDFDTLSDADVGAAAFTQPHQPKQQDFDEGTAESALSYSRQHQTATEAVASTLRFSRGISAAAERAEAGSAQGQPRAQVHWGQNKSVSASQPRVENVLQQAQWRQPPRSGPMLGDKPEQRPTPEHSMPADPAGSEDASIEWSTTKEHPGAYSQVPNAGSFAGEAREGSSCEVEDTPPLTPVPSFEAQMAVIGRTFFESCAQLKVTSVHQIARLGAREALLGVLSLADYLALGGQVGEARLSIPAPRDVGASAQADMFSLGVMQECLMGRQAGARGVWSTASAALLHGAATAAGDAAPTGRQGAENVLAGLGGEGLLKSTSAWNSIRSQVAILISRCEEYCLQGHLRRKWAIMWDALYQRLLMFVAWHIARSVEGFSFLASAPLQPGAGSQAALAGEVRRSPAASKSAAYGWEHGHTSSSRSVPSAKAMAAAGAACRRLEPPAWLRVGASAAESQAVSDPQRADSVMTAGSRGASTTADVMGSTGSSQMSSGSAGVEVHAVGGWVPTVPCLDPPLGNVLGGAIDGDAPRGSQRASLLYGRLASFVISSSHGCMGDCLRLLMVMQQLKTTFRSKAQQVDAVQATLGPEAAEQFLQGPDRGVPAQVQFTASELQASSCCPSPADVRFILGEVVSLWNPSGAVTDGRDDTDSYKLDHLLLLQQTPGAHLPLRRSAVAGGGSSSAPLDGPTLQPLRFWQLVTHPIPSIQALLGQDDTRPSASGPKHGTSWAAVAPSARRAAVAPSARWAAEQDSHSVQHLLQQVHEAAATARPWRDVKMSALAAVLPPLRARADVGVDGGTEAGHAGPLEAALEAATTNQHTRKLPAEHKETPQSGHMLADFSELLAHLLDCLLLARAASTALGAAAAGRSNRPSALSPGFSATSSGNKSLDLSAGGRQRLVFDLHLAETILHLNLYVEFAAWFSTQELA